MSIGMKIAIIDESSQLQFHGLAAAQHCVLHARSVLAVTHPNAFLEECITNGKPPHRSISVQSEAFNMHVALGFNCSTGPTIGCQRVIQPVETNCFIDLCYQ